MPACLRLLVSVLAAGAVFMPAPGMARNEVEIRAEERKIIITARMLMIIPWEVYNPDAARGLTPRQRQTFRDIRSNIEELDGKGISFFRTAIEPKFKQLPPFKGCYKFTFQVRTEIVDNLAADVRRRDSGYHVLLVLPTDPVPLPPDPGETAVKMWGPAANLIAVYAGGGDPYATTLSGRIGAGLGPQPGGVYAGIAIGALFGFGVSNFDVAGEQFVPFSLTPDQLGQHLEQLGYEFPEPECITLKRAHDYQQDFGGATNRASYDLNAVIEEKPDGTVTGTATVGGAGWGRGPTNYIEYGADGTYEVTGRRNGDMFVLDLDGALLGWDTIGGLGRLGPQHYSWTIEAGPLDENGVWEDRVEQTECIGEQEFIRCAPGSRLQTTSVLKEEKPREGGPGDGAESLPGGGTVAAGDGGGEDNGGVATLASALAGGDIFARRLAAESLGALGPQAAPSVDALVQATGADDSTLQRLAATALGHIGPEAAPAVPSLRRLLGHEDARARIAASVALWKVGGTADAAVPILTEAIGSQEPQVIAAAAAAAGSLGTAGEALVAPLRQLLDPSHPWTFRVNAASSLWQITGDTDRSVLIDALEDGTPPAQVAAAEALARIAAAERDVAPRQPGR